MKLFERAKKCGIGTFFAISLIFFVVCLHYAIHLNLWGDEAVSFKLAELPFADVIRQVDVHAPTYFFILKFIMILTGQSYSSEIFIRLIHVLIFSGGLYFGWKIIKTLFNTHKIIILTMLFVIFLPSFIFYATNTRMYAPLFCFSMWFIYAVLRYLNQHKPMSLTKNWDILLSGLLLVCTDYIGLLYYGLGVFFILIKSDKKNDRNLWFFIVFPLSIFLLYLAPIILPSIKLILNWSHGSISISKIHESGGTTIIKLIFSIAKPFIELTNIAFQKITIPIVYLCVYGFFLICGTVYLTKKFLLEKDWGLLFIIAIAYSWIITSFFGLSLTRVFLPAQFFMSVIILYGLLELKLLKRSYLAVYLGLILFNLYSALSPVYHFTSSIPYHVIAQNMLQIARQTQTNTLLISGNSLNSESILRYISQENHYVDARRLDVAFNKIDVPKKPFLFLSYMDENNFFIDVKQFSSEFHKKVTMINHYVNLNDLQYNSIWKNNILDRTNQQYAYVLYRVE